MASGGGGKKAFGFCDRCGFRYPLNSLKREVQSGVLVNNRVCRHCRDTDNQQYKVGRKALGDPYPLADQRPDPSMASSRSLAGFNPVRGFTFSAELGIVRTT